jgi:hypothetical protein
MREMAHQRRQEFLAATAGMDGGVGGGTVLKGSRPPSRHSSGLYVNAERTGSSVQLGGVLGQLDMVRELLSTTRSELQQSDALLSDPNITEEQLVLAELRDDESFVPERGEFSNTSYASLKSPEHFKIRPPPLTGRSTWEVQGNSIPDAAHRGNISSAATQLNEGPPLALNESFPSFSATLNSLYQSRLELAELLQPIDVSAIQ